MHMPRLVLLRDHLEYSDTFALWVHIHDRGEYYARRGWEYMEPFHAWGKEHGLMQRKL